MSSARVPGFFFTNARMAPDCFSRSWGERRWRLPSSRALDPRFAPAFATRGARAVVAIRGRCTSGRPLASTSTPNARGPSPGRCDSAAGNLGERLGGFFGDGGAEVGRELCDQGVDFAAHLQHRYWDCAAVGKLCPIACTKYRCCWTQGRKPSLRRRTLLRTNRSSAVHKLGGPAVLVTPRTRPNLY